MAKHVQAEVEDVFSQTLYVTKTTSGVAVVFFVILALFTNVRLRPVIYKPVIYIPHFSHEL